MPDEPVQYALTTVDNPYDPFTQFYEWNAYDQHHGYNSLALLGRIARTSSDLPEPQYLLEVKKAIEEIVEHNASGMHMKVSNISKSND